jgi:DNA repair protein RecO (recombination protein O)
MPNIVKTEGIVLKGMDFLETSRIVTIYTKKFGKVKVLAKGIRRPKSKFGSSLETLTRSAIVFYKREQKDLYTVSESDILVSFSKLRQDLLGFGFASILTDFLDKANPAEGSNPRLYRLSLGTLSAMERCVQMRNAECEVENSAIRIPNSEFEMLLWGFLWRGISYVGFKPELEKCVACKKLVGQPIVAMVAPEAPPESISSLRWSSSLGGILCRNCVERDEESSNISEEALNFLRHLKNGFETLSIPDSNDTLLETKSLIKEYLTYHLQNRLHSFDFLNSMQNLLERIPAEK